MTVHELRRLKEPTTELSIETLFEKTPRADDFADRAERVAAVAALHADDVDRDDHDRR